MFFGVGSYVSLGSSHLHIGDGVLFGSDVMIIGGDHNYLALGQRMWESTSGGTEADIRVDDDVWCGARAILLKGVRIREGTVVGAGSVVTRELPPYIVAAGNPCRPRKLRFSDEELAEHLRARGRTQKEAAAIVQERRAAAGGLPVAHAQ